MNQLVPHLPIVGSCIALSMAVVAFMGWTFDVPLLRTGVPGAPATSPLTALLLAILAAVLVNEAYALDPASPRKRRTLLGGCGVAAIALLVLAQYAFGWGAILETVFFPDRLEALGGSYPGRPSPQTSACLFCLATALVCASRPTRTAGLLATVASLGGTAIPTTALLGYAIDAGPLYSLPTEPLTGMSPITLLGTFSLGLGCLALNRGGHGSRFGWCMSLILFSIGVLALDYVTGPFILFPITFVIPVALAALHLGKGASLGFALVLSLSRFALVALFREEQVPMGAALINLIIRTVVLVALGLLTHRLRLQATGSQARLAAIVDGANDAVVGLDLNGIVTSWNSAAERTFGFSAAEMIGQSVRVLVPADRLAEENDIMKRIRRGERIGGFETVRLRKDGFVIPVGLTVSPIRFDGEVVGMSKIVRDLSERKRAERRFERIVQAAPDAVVIVDRWGRIVLVNSQVETMFGLNREELLGREVEILIPERFRDAHPRRRDEYVGDPQVRPMGAGQELYGRRRDGSEFPVEISLSPLESDEGLLVVAAIRDITERNKARQAVEDSLREKEVLLREIHHRVKNNLAVIGSLLYLQSTRTQDEATVRVLHDCQDRVRSMALVHERLYRSGDLARIDFAEYTEELANQLFRNNNLSPGAIRMTFDLEKVSLDIDRAIPCGLILNELMTNALKHAFFDGRSGEIRVGLHVDGKGAFTLSIADNGVGLPDEASLQARRSLGMRLIHSLAGQLDARVELIRLNPGTEIRLTLEVSHAHEP